MPPPPLPPYDRLLAAKNAAALAFAFSTTCASSTMSSADWDVARSTAESGAGADCCMAAAAAAATAAAVVAGPAGAPPPWIFPLIVVVVVPPSPRLFRFHFTL